MGTSESEMERGKEREKVNTGIDDSDESQEELDEKVKKSNDSSRKVNYS